MGVEYFAAVQEGRRRVNRAIAALQEVVGSCYPMLFLKAGISDWTPVGEELLHKIVQGNNKTGALVICDGDGNAKAMSAWVAIDRADEFAKALESKGIPSYEGDVKLPI
jgi:hypothetical protein